LRLHKLKNNLIIKCLEQKAFYKLKKSLHLYDHTMLYRQR